MLNRINSAILLCVGIGLAYLIGILSTHHIIPSYTGLFVGMQIVTVLSLTLLLTFIILRKNTLEMSVSTFTWLFLAFLILIQPLLNHISYPDHLVFPVVACILLAATSIAIKQVIAEKLENRMIICHLLAFFILIGGVLTGVTLWLQLFGVDVPFIAKVPVGSRPIGNVWQPNQAAFIVCLGIIAAMYMQEYLHKKFMVLPALGILFMASSIALTASRGGVIMMAGIPLLYGLITNHHFKIRFLKVFLFSTIMVIGYWIGIYVFNEHIGSVKNALSRLTNDSVSERALLQQLAFTLFKENPVAGYGWGNYTLGGFNHALSNDWFVLTYHSHIAITQIAAELGVLGLMLFIPLLWIIYKNINFNMQPVQVFPVMVVALTLIYSLSEFPLWYLKYSLIFAVCLALIDPSSTKIKANFNCLAIALSGIVFVAVIFYQREYIKYNHMASMVYSDQVDSSSASQLSGMFGFTQYKDQFIYYTLPLDNVHLKEKISLGERVISKVPSMIFLEKQAVYYALDSDPDRSLELFKKACLLNYYKDCALLEKNLRSYAYSSPIVFKEIYVQFMQWKKEKR